MAIPRAIANTMESTSLMTAKSIPRIDAVRGVESRVIPGPANRNVMAGPKPAPFFQMPAKRGRMVHEHTSMMRPLVAAKPLGRPLGM